MADENTNIAQRTAPHKGTYGVCAPQSIAGDQRALISRPFATIAYGLLHTSGVLSPVRTNGSYGQTDCAFVVGTAGIGERGYDVGITDTLSRHETSFFAEGFPFRDYEFVLRGIAVVPEGKPFRAASSLDASRGSLSIGGDQKGAGNNGAAIIEPLAAALGDAVVNLFFQSTSLQLGFKSESAKWDLATPLFHPGGYGLENSAVPSNGIPAGGRVMQLPFEVQLPRANTRGTSVAQILVRQELTKTIVSSTNNFTVDGANVLAETSGAQVDPKYLVQLFKVILVGERICVADSAEEIIRQMAQQAGCSVEQARAMLAVMPNRG